MNPPMLGSKKCGNKEWAVMFEKLEAYKRGHNTCNVPKRYAKDPKLGHWVHYQRTMCKSKKLSQDRKDMLESIGFVWSERQTSSTSREQTSWDERFQELKAFHSVHGHCKVPRKGENAALGRWVKWQRWNRTLLDRGESSVLTKRKIKLLNSINFNWGYQRVQTNTAPPKPAETEVPIEPLPYMPTETKSSAKVLIEPLPYMSTETKSSTINQDERQHVVSPPFPISSFESRMTNSSGDDRASFSSRFGGSTNFFGQEINASSLFNRNQANFVRPSMSPFEGDYDRFDRQATDSSNAFELNFRIQAFQNRTNFMRNNFQGMHRPNDVPMMRPSFKDQMNTGMPAVTKCWKCSVCRYASFDTYEDALAHENNCNGYPEGSFCRACAA